MPMAGCTRAFSERTLSFCALVDIAVEIAVRKEGFVKGPIGPSLPRRVIGPLSFSAGRMGRLRLRGER